MGKIRKIKRLERELVLKRFKKHQRRNFLAEPGVHDIAIVLDNLKQSFNVGKIFRSGDAFGVSGIHLVGTDFFDPAPAKGGFKWVPASFYRDFSACYERLVDLGYTIFVLEPGNNRMIDGEPLPKKCAFVFGHEEFGISFSKEDFPDVRGLSIPQFGRVQSLNVSVAASIVMYEYIRQHGGKSSIKQYSKRQGKREYSSPELAIKK